MTNLVMRCNQNQLILGDEGKLVLLTALRVCGLKRAWSWIGIVMTILHCKIHSITLIEKYIPHYKAAQGLTIKLLLREIG